MKKLLLVFISIISIWSCHKECGCDAPPFSDTCLDETFDKFKQQTNALAIIEYKFKDEYVYLLDDGASHFDGVSPIINNKCDTICGFGGWVQQECFKEMTQTGEVWRK